MKKVLLDLSIPDSKERTHEYIAEQMGFPEHYGKNLDALYDELSSVSEATAVGIFMPIADMMNLDIDLMIYFDKIGEVFLDAEKDNPSLAVIFGDLASNPGYEDRFEELYGACAEGEDQEEDMPGDKDVLFLDIGKRRQ